MAVTVTPGAGARPTSQGASYAAPAQSFKLVAPVGLYARDIQRALIQKYPVVNSLRWMYDLGNVAKRVTNNFRYEFFEEGQWFYAADTAAALGGAPGTTPGLSGVEITLTGFTDPNQKIFPNIGSVGVITNGGTDYRFVVNSKVGDDKIGVWPLTAGFTEANVAVNDNILFYTTAFDEDSTAPDGQVVNVTKEENVIQTFRRAFPVTDHEHMSEVMFEVNGQPHLYVKGIENTSMLFDMDHELAFLMGDIAGSTFASGADDPMTQKATAPYAQYATGAAQSDGSSYFTTGGLIPTIDDRGFTVAGAIDTMDPIADFEDIVTQIDVVFGPSDYMMGHGLGAGLQLDKIPFNVALTGGNGGNIDFSPVGGQEQAISLNLRYVNYSGYQFFFQRWPILSHSDSLGKWDPTLTNTAFGIPLGKTPNPRTNAGSKNFENYCQMVYMDPPGSPQIRQGDVLIWETGALAKGGPTDDRARRTIHMMDYKGFEMRNKEKFFRWNMY